MGQVELSPGGISSRDEHLVSVPSVFSGGDSGTPSHEAISDSLPGTTIGHKCRYTAVQLFVRVV